ncbi:MULTISPECIES: NAD-dependent succinate-semialdehyde dehydrogenase [unclassified Pseudomonas]|uniref:NAD-dependent succinate-semialdehyde dehydrogenase n=1 Tax=unclassified Pseudomonas TaxID=196821 RepID=UPI0008CB6F8E|nr:MULTISPECIES: NAD-dependent succinate-semialdehyde dehydrogenase [unclassified Pseudomonas]SEO57840.1 succinate-semialdehyde dehydrogenase / glutarate-semialdehyde dehydrogenase [Pseudomonas sp. NFACC39-1]SFG93589.1 succinate-semialdehyde dehydrogenase / glutarate-semialdehyde dehydrogenase [Pseudomonas sp. NFACC45]
MAVTLNNPALFRNQAFIGGEWTSALDGRTYEVLDPSTGALITVVPDMSAVEAAEAIVSAKAAGKDWSAKSAKQRARILRDWHDLILANREDLAALITLEQGKPMAEARAEIDYGAAYIEWFAEEAKRVNGDVLPAPSDDRRIVVIKQPIGVVAAITPWNFPMAMITRKVAPALAAGCTIVVKPAEDTPLSALALVELAREAGVINGAFNVITAARGHEVGEVLTTHPDVRKVSFTGSTQVGRILLRQCADTIKKVSLELGGNAPFIVFDDADLEAAVAGAMACKFRNGGQACISANRIFVQSGIYDAFAARLSAEVKQVQVGPGTLPNVALGPMINGKAIEKIESHVADACMHGAKVLVGGARHELGGNFYAPTVLVDVTPPMLVNREETFGPVAPLIRFEDERQVVEQANDTEFGLASYFYTRDHSRAWRVAEQLESGMVGVNTGLISNEMAPFGGIKQSGLGREGSAYGIEDYLEIKYMCVGGI